jgi:AcrR family transcriptional regulator
MSAQTAARSAEPQRSERRTEILERATGVFARYGFRKTTLDDIGEACGLGKAALYHYFKGKDDIFATVVAREGNRALDQLRAAAAAEADPEDQLIAVLKLRLAMPKRLLAEKAVSKETALELLPLAHDAMKEVLRGEVMLVTRILEAGRRKGVFKVRSTESVALALLSAIRAMDPQLLMIHSPEKLTVGIDELLGLLIRGLTR